MAKDSTGIILALGGAGLAYYGYTQGWFASLGFGTPAQVSAAGAAFVGGAGATPAMAAAQQQAAAQAALLNQLASQGKPTSTGAPVSSSVPALGTVVNTASDIAAQAGANLLYIVPGATMAGQAPAGYVLMAVTDRTAAPSGFVYLRADVANKFLNDSNGVIQQLNQLNATNTGYIPQALLTIASLSNTPSADLSGVKAAITAGGLSGLGAFEIRRWLRA